MPLTSPGFALWLSPSSTPLPPLSTSEAPAYVSGAQKTPTKRADQVSGIGPANADDHEPSTAGLRPSWKDEKKAGGMRTQEAAHHAPRPAHTDPEELLGGRLEGASGTWLLVQRRRRPSGKRPACASVCATADGSWHAIANNEHCSRGGPRARDDDAHSRTQYVWRQCGRRCASGFGQLSSLRWWSFPETRIAMPLCNDSL